jgi:hypothetical protein
LPSTPEAIFVSLVDNLDAKMGMVTHLLTSTRGVADFFRVLPGTRDINVDRANDLKNRQNGVAKMTERVNVIFTFLSISVECGKILGNKKFFNKVQ